MDCGAYQQIVEARRGRALAIAEAGGLTELLASSSGGSLADVTLSEAIVLGLLRQGVRTFYAVFGHGSTEVAEVLRVYADAGLVDVHAVRSEIEAAHAAAALRWVTDEKAAVLTSIGPGALQALAASLVAASDGLGVWFLCGDETTEDEGPNMQQIPKAEQGTFLRMFGAMGDTYTLHTPGSVSTALRRGLNTVDHPYRAGPFFLLMPMNTQCSVIDSFNLNELPYGCPPVPGAARAGYTEAANFLIEAERVVVKVGGGAREAGKELLEFLELCDGVVVTSPLVSGVIPYAHPRNMTVGGSKGSLCGNYAMDEADLLVSLGSRSVCQADSSRTGYPNAKHVININADTDAATHYGRTTALVGDMRATLRRLNDALRNAGAEDHADDESPWLTECRAKKEEWESFKAERYATPCLFDEVFGREVLTQPAAIKVAADWGRENGAVSFFDAGDVQANGFQIVEDDRLGRTFTDTGASYMGFAVSALLASGTASPENRFYGVAFTGDGSFMMNPQILIDGVEHGATGCILLLDNRRMAAISGLQTGQFGTDFSTNDHVEVDYVAMASAFKGVHALHGGHSPEELIAALNKAKAYDGLSLVYVPVYYGPDALGNMGVFGRWNVGNWCDEVQALRHEIGL